MSFHAKRGSQCQQKKELKYQLLKFYAKAPDPDSEIGMLDPSRHPLGTESGFYIPRPRATSQVANFFTWDAV